MADNFASAHPDIVQAIIPYLDDPQFIEFVKKYCDTNQANIQVKETNQFDFSLFLSLFGRH
uniref:Uncharacterized protein n=1 Tax=viral metagenome TaxID=1070528 RepID=A0A6C0EAN4_9ZZZZ